MISVCDKTFLIYIFKFNGNINADLEHLLHLPVSSNAPIISPVLIRLFV